MLDIPKHRSPQRVVVTGLGVASAIGCSVPAFWESLLAGKSGVQAITSFDVSQCRTRIGAQIRDEWLENRFSRKEQQRLSRASQLALLAADEAVKQAQLDLTAQRIGVILGSSNGGLVAVEPFYRNFFQGGSTDPFCVPLIMNHAPAANVAIRYGCRGPVMAIDAACASSAHNIGYSFMLIRGGMLDMALTGGADTALASAALSAWSSLRVLSERNETPQQACRPFSQDRDGIVLGEGAGVLLLEAEHSALTRGATILAEVTGYGANGDGYHLTQPTLSGVSEAMQLALADASLNPGDIDYINAHATGTVWNDRTESAAINATFADTASQIPVVGIKPVIGHSIAASGALEFISCILSLRDNLVPPTINRVVPDPECTLDYVTEGARALPLTHVMSNSFGFGGSNGVLIASRYPQPLPGSI